MRRKRLAHPRPNWASITDWLEALGLEMETWDALVEEYGAPVWRPEDPIRFDDSRFWFPYRFRGRDPDDSDEP